MSNTVSIPTHYPLWLANAMQDTGILCLCICFFENTRKEI